MVSEEVNVVSKEELDKILQERFDPRFDPDCWFQSQDSKFDVAKILLAAALGVGSSRSAGPPRVTLDSSMPSRRMAAAP